ncbi:PepSY domain-containing protein [Acetobacter okinawensis]|uniref:PepSY-associated TM helix domain-containing protein n=1 Tax=Acetobacter okinawensis TaxID=1076594 RepID=UPI000A3CDE29|nr:PepSY-associated TM helix domain-containing protein [Acetobacter okinawensis]
MKLRADIVQAYRDIHSWVGILCGLFLFVAFYAGSISMFEQPLQNWLTPATPLPSPVNIENTPELLQKALAEYPEAGRHYILVINPDRAQPARLMWPQDPTHRGHGPQDFMLAALSPDGKLVTAARRPSEIPFFIDQLHEQVGLPLPHTMARYFMGCVALAYFLALVSGIIAFLPALKKMLFAVRLNTGARKVWLDLHNLLGFFSLPFHCVIALTAAVFAFHEPVFTVQEKLFQSMQGVGQSAAHGHKAPENSKTRTEVAVVGKEMPLAPALLLATVQQQAPGFVADTLEYTAQRGKGKSGLVLRVAGHDARYPMRGATNGFAMVDPASGKILSTDYLPGHQSRGLAVLTAFFALHFGSYGGLPVRWGYYCLGVGGAFLFYTGNRLWILARIRREHSATTLSRQTRGTWVLSCLMTGCITGCMAGIALLFICAPFLPLGGTYGQASALYYAAFVLCMALAFSLGERLREPVLFCLAGLVNVAVAPVLLVSALFTGSVTLTGLCTAAITLLLGTFLLYSVKRSGCRIAV